MFTQSLGDSVFADCFLFPTSIHKISHLGDKLREISNDSSNREHPNQMVFHELKRDPLVDGGTARTPLGEAQGNINVQT